MTLDIKGHHPISFDFSSAERRDEAIRRLVEAIEAVQPKSSESLSSAVNSKGSPSPLMHSRSPSQGSDIVSDSLPSMTFSNSGNSIADVLSPLHRAIDRAKTHTFPTHVLPHLPKVINLPRDSFPIITPKHFVCLTIGSRGDVQPYIALALGLKAHGHRVTIVTHAEYKEWIEGWGIGHRTAGGDPGALMKLSVENKVILMRVSSCVSKVRLTCVLRCFLPSFSKKVYRT